MHENWGKSFFCAMDKKMVSNHIEWWIGKCPGLCTIVFKTSILYLKFMLYHAVFWGPLYFFPFCALTVLNAFFWIFQQKWENIFCNGFDSVVVNFSIHTKLPRSARFYNKSFKLPAPSHWLHYTIVNIRFQDLFITLSS